LTKQGLFSSASAALTPCRCQQRHVHTCTYTLLSESTHTRTRPLKYTRATRLHVISSSARMLPEKREVDTGSYSSTGCSTTSIPVGGSSLTYTGRYDRYGGRYDGSGTRSAPATAVPRHVDRVHTGLALLAWPSSKASAVLRTVTVLTVSAVHGCPLAGLAVLPHPRRHWPAAAPRSPQRPPRAAVGPWGPVGGRSRSSAMPMAGCP